MAQTLRLPYMRQITMSDICMRVGRYRPLRAARVLRAGLFRPLVLDADRWLSLGVGPPTTFRAIVACEAAQQPSACVVISSVPTSGSATRPPMPRP